MIYKKTVSQSLFLILFFCSTINSSFLREKELALKIYNQVENIDNFLVKSKQKIIQEWPKGVGFDEIKKIKVLREHLSTFRDFYDNCVFDILSIKEMLFFEYALIDMVEQFFIAREVRFLDIKYELPASIDYFEKVIQENQKRIDNFFEMLEQFIYKPVASSRCKDFGSCVKKVADHTVFSKPFAIVGGVASGLYIFNRLFSISKDKKNIEIDRDSFAVKRRNILRGYKITPYNIYNLSPKIPSALEKKVNRWFKQNKDVWKTVVRQNGPFKACKEKEKRARNLMSKKGLDYYPSGSNFIFVFPDQPEWLVKISGPMNRACLQVANQNLQHGRIDFVNTNKLVSTCQTSSRIFYLLKLKEAIKKYRLSEIEAVEGYLWSPFKSCDDKKVVYLEKILKNHILFKDCSRKKLDEILTFERVRQLLLAAEHAGLWDLKGNNIAINKKNKKLVIIDTEQPNTTKLSQLFNKDKKRYKYNIKCAAQSLYKTFEKKKLKARHHIKYCINRDPEFRNSNI